MIVDLHCHTNAHSGCAVDAPSAMLSAARQVGLGAVAITEHDYAWQGEALARHADGSMNGLRVIPAVELTVFAPHNLMAHVLVFADDPPSGPIYDLAGLRDYASAPNRALVQAHPYRYHDGAERVAEMLGVHAIEVDSGNVDAFAASQALALAERLGLPGVAGSDAHRRTDVGMYATRFEREVRSAAEIAVEIRAGRVAPVRYHPRTRDWE